jgi:hypothetical protein
MNYIKQTKGTETYTRTGTDEKADYSLGGVKDQSLSLIGAETKISIQSGFTMEGKGILNRVSYASDGFQIKGPK